MARVVMELTNRCNLRCRHCFSERHAGTGDLPFAVIANVLRDGKQCGIDHISFTGGEPTIHRRFGEIVDAVSGSGYSFSLVTNGGTFMEVYPLFEKHRQWFTGATFSLDGAREVTHDRLRGRGSYREVMRAASICVLKQLNFTFNMVLTNENRDEVHDMLRLAHALGSRGVRFGHLMHTPETERRGLNLSLEDRRCIEATIWELRKQVKIPVGMAPGYYSDSPFFPCGPLELQEFNVDYRGNLTLCCQLSGQSSSSTDVVASLQDLSLAGALDIFRQRVATYLADKSHRMSTGQLGEFTHFPCLYCARYVNENNPHTVTNRRHNLSQEADTI
jgi:MoaA/NifB/PqqE/SkfB family radical SAM enzyme